MVIYLYVSYQFHNAKDQNGAHHPKVCLILLSFKSDFSASCDSSSH